MNNEQDHDNEIELPEDQIDPTEEALNAVRSKIDHYDFGRAVGLMGVLEKVATTGVKNTAIGGLASLALNEMNDEAIALRQEFQKVFEEATARREQLIQERQRREAEEQEELNNPRDPARVIPAGNFDPTPGQPARPRPQDVERPRGPAASATNNDGDNTNPGPRRL